jgi:hypothetical protein
MIIFSLAQTLNEPASSEKTQKKLGSRPTGPGLIADLEQLRSAES